MIETGQCRCIPDAFTFVAGGWHGENIRVVSEAELYALPSGPDIPRAESLIIDTEPTDLGENHWMHTKARVNRATGKVEVNTRIWAGTAEGFHGAVAIVLTDADGLAVLALPDQKQQRRYGVDGKGFGTSFRDENWSFQVDPNEAPRIVNVRVIQS